MKRVPAGVAAVANMHSPGAQVAAVSAALDEALARASDPAETAAKTTMEMIAESPGALVAESEASAQPAQEMRVSEVGQA